MVWNQEGGGDPCGDHAIAAGQGRTGNRQARAGTASFQFANMSATFVTV